jgi:ATP-dependent helicase/nuclease subunit B
MQKALGRVAPMLRVYRRPSQKAAFLQQLLNLFDELASYRVEPELLGRQAEHIQGATRDKLLDLSMLYSAYLVCLEESGIDTKDKLERLAERMESSGYLRGKDVFIDGFTYFNTMEREVLRQILRQARSVTVTLLGEPDSREEIFETSVQTLGQLQELCTQERQKLNVQVLKRQGSDALGHLEREFFGETIQYEGEDLPIRVLAADNTFTEVEQAAAEIRRLVAAGKCRYRDITVAARNMGDYEGVIEMVFRRYGIPVYLNRRSDILEKPVVALLTGVLAAIGNGYEYEDMFQWLKT